MNALGMIETRGLAAAIAGADAMVKAADVRIASREQVGAGLVTVAVRGEVAAVQAAVDAGAAEIRRMGGCLVSVHVIARPDPELASVIGGGPQASQAPQTSQTSQVTQVTQAAPEEEKAPGAGAHQREKPAYDISQLGAMTVGRLRRIAAGLPGLPLEPGQIGTARKKTLIEAIMTAYRQE